jgi:hypothetical protein
MIGLDQWWNGWTPGPYLDNCPRGSISYTLPGNFSQMIVMFAVEGSNLYYDGITMMTGGQDPFYYEYIQEITPGKVLRIDEGCNWIGADLQIILRNGCQGPTCPVGFTGPDGGTCLACEAGKFKTTRGSVACTDCGAGKYSTATGAFASCVCTDCGANTYSTATGATVASTCQNCPSNTQSAAGSTALTSCVYYYSTYYCDAEDGTCALSLFVLLTIGLFGSKICFSHGTVLVE